MTTKAEWKVAFLEAAEEGINNGLLDMTSSPAHGSGLDMDARVEVSRFNNELQVSVKDASGLHFYSIKVKENQS